MSLQIIALGPNDVRQFSDLVTLLAAVFEMDDFRMPSMIHLQTLLQKENFLAIVATSDNEIVGGLTIYVLDSCYSTRPIAYIYDLAVAKNKQRQGIGTRLIEFAKTYCRSKGFRELFVQAETIDDYALEFYRSTGITTEQDVRHFSYTL